MPFRNIEFPQLLRDNGLSEVNCPVWGVKWASVPPRPATQVSNDPGAIEGCFATSEEAQVELDDLQQEPREQVATQPEENTRKKNTRARNPRSRHGSDGAQESLAQLSYYSPVLHNTATSNGHADVESAYATSVEVADTLGEMTLGRHHLPRAVVQQALSTYSSLANALDEFPRILPNYAPQIRITTGHLSATNESKEIATTMTSASTHEPSSFESPTKTVVRPRPIPYSPAPLSAMPVPPASQVDTDLLRAHSMTTTPSLEDTYIPSGDPRQYIHAPTRASTTAPYAFAHYQDAEAPNEHPAVTPSQTFAPAQTQAMLVSPAPRHAFQPAGFNLCNNPSTPDASTPQLEQPLWNVAGTPQDYGTPSTDASAWTPGAPATPSPVHWQEGGISIVDVSGVESPHCAFQAQAEQVCYAAAPHTQYASELFNGVFDCQSGHVQAEWPQYKPASYPRSHFG